MTTDDPAVEQLLDRAESGSDSAVNELLTMYRARLKKMVTVRLDERMSARVDPSDIIQETCVEAVRRLPDYLRNRPVPFYFWLRGLAVQRLIDMRRRHLTAAKRSVKREVPGYLELSDRSALALMNQLFASVSSPSKQLHRQEIETRLREALARLDETDQEILVLRYLEELSPREIAGLLGLTDRAIRRRHRLALAKLSETLSDWLEG
jgi:RNA polymerase sigma-70 factor (ECF subfamily)